MCNQSGPPHFGCVKLSAGDGRFAIAWALFEHINAKIHSSWSGALNKYVATRLDPASPIAPIRFAISTSSLVIGRFGPLTLKKKKLGEFLTKCLFTCLTFGNPPEKVSKKRGDTLTNKIFTPNTPARKRGWGPCPDYGFLGYFINVRNLPCDTGGERVDSISGNVSPRLEACYVPLICCHMLPSCAMLSLPFANCSPIRTSDQLAIISWQTYRKITVPLLPCESSEQEFCLEFEVQNFESHRHTCAFRIFIGESLCNRQHLRCSQNPDFVVSNWDLLNVPLNNFNSTSFLIEPYPLANLFQASKAIPSAPEWLKVVILKVMRRNSYSHCCGFSFLNLWCLWFLCWNLCIRRINMDDLMSTPGVTSCPNGVDARLL